MMKLFLVVALALGAGFAQAESKASTVITVQGKAVDLSKLSRDELTVLARLLQKSSDSKDPKAQAALCF
jgi:hypothetical protein